LTHGSIPRLNVAKGVLNVVKDGELVAIFHSIHRVMKAEKILKQAQMSILLIPVPRQLTSDCGLAIRFEASLRGEVEATLAAAGLEIQELHQRQAKTFICLKAP